MIATAEEITSSLAQFTQQQHELVAAAIRSGAEPALDPTAARALELKAQGANAAVRAVEVDLAAALGRRNVAIEAHGKAVGAFAFAEMLQAEDEFNDALDAAGEAGMRAIAAYLFAREFRATGESIHARRYPGGPVGRLFKEMRSLDWKHLGRPDWLGGHANWSSVKFPEVTEHYQALRNAAGLALPAAEEAEG
jgi:hypothetical protein